MLVGGDMYGFESLGSGDHRNAMLVMSNAGSPQRNRGLRRFAEDLAALVTGRQAAKFLIGVQFGVDGDTGVKIAKVIEGGAA
jgi:hypothetical protein